ncbi:phasin family protein [Atopobiaceae bacterium 24-176]
MADDQKNPIEGLGDMAHNVFLAGVGAAAIVGEKASQVVDDLVKKGELTVQQGKVVNEELSQKAAGVVNETTEALIKNHLKSMTPEQRAEFVASVRSMADDIENKADEAADDAAASADEAADAVEADAIEVDED